VGWKGKTFGWKQALGQYGVGPPQVSNKVEVDSQIIPPVFVADSASRFLSGMGRSPEFLFHPLFLGFTPAEYLDDGIDYEEESCEEDEDLEVYSEDDIVEPIPNLPVLRASESLKVVVDPLLG
jgi:hypothetical protein